METTVETQQHQLALQWVINDVTDQDIIKEALAYKPGRGWFRNRMEHLEVLGVVAIVDAPLKKVRSRIHQLNHKNGKHFTVVPPTHSYPNVRVYRDK
jgi:hypothetical protein